MKLSAILCAGMTLVLGLIISIYMRYDFLHTFVQEPRPQNSHSSTVMHKLRPEAHHFISPNSSNEWIDNQPSLSFTDTKIAVQYTLPFEHPLAYRRYTLNHPAVNKKPFLFAIRTGKKNACFEIMRTNAADTSQKTNHNAIAMPMQKQSSAHSSFDHITHLTFWLYHENHDTDIGIALWNSHLSDRYPLKLIHINRFVHHQQESGWQPVIIPIRETNFSPSGTELPTISFFSFNTPHTLYIDSIQLCTMTDLVPAKKFRETLRTSCGKKLIAHATEHFQIYSSYNPYIAEQAGRCCELVFKNLYQLFDKELSLEQKVMVAVFSSRKEYVKFIEKMQYNPDHSRALYIFINNFSFIGTYMDQGMSESEVYATLVHETTHLFLKRYFGHQKIPLWLNEGLAVYYEQTTFEYGNIDSTHKQLIYDKTTAQGTCNLTHLLETFNTHYSNEKFTVDEKYLYSYSLISFLVYHNKLKHLLFYLKRGYTPADALSLLFDAPLEHIEGEWNSFLALDAKK
ncbi:hypothetical protein KDK77_08025 [bacterium]|nr:hypothetical protein [bacterium]MCP5462854.1 hypothetical protein [bacterium]